METEEGTQEQEMILDRLRTIADTDMMFLWILEFTFGGTIILVTASAIAWITKGSRPSVRHACWNACMLLLAAIPLLVTLPSRFTLKLPAFPVPGLTTETDWAGEAGETRPETSPTKPSNAESVDRRANESVSLDRKTASFRFGSAESTVLTAPPSNHRLRHEAAFNPDAPSDVSFRSSIPQLIPHSIFFTWALGAFSWLLRIVMSYRRLCLLQRSSKPISNRATQRLAATASKEMGLRVNIRLVSRPDFQMPMVAGLRAPVILLPQFILRSSEQAQRAVLLHEMGHIRRRDLTFAWLAEIAGLFFWFHPLYWHARRQHAMLREQACDDSVLHQNVCPGAYAKCLLSVVAREGGGNVPGVSGLAMSQQNVEQRIRRILYDSADRRPLGTKMFFVITLLSFALIVPAASIRAATAAIPQDRLAQQDVAPNDSDQKTASGRVLDQNGLPIQDAIVFSQTWDSTKRRPSVTSVRTNQSGYFKVVFKAAKLSPKNVYPIWIWAEGYQLQTVSLQSPFFKSRRVEGVVIELPDQARTRFRVLQPDGRPLANAFLTPSEIRVAPGFLKDGRFRIRKDSGLLFDVQDLPELAEVIGSYSDENGIVELSEVPISLFHRVDVHADQYGTQRFALRSGLRDLRMQEVGEIHGRVEVPDPSLISGAKVQIRSTGFSPFHRVQGIANVQIDEHGRFHIPAILASRKDIKVQVFAWNDELNAFPVLNPNSARRVQVGGPLELLIRTEPTVRVEGRILTDDKRSPVAGATVGVRSVTGLYHGDQAVTDANGAFSLRTLPGLVRRQITSMGDDHTLYGRYEYPNLDEISIPSGVETYRLEPFLLKSREQAF